MIGAATLVALLVSAGWAIFQTQLAGILAQVESLRRESEKANQLLAHEHERREIELKTEILRFRSEYIARPESDAFAKRVDQYMATPFLKSSEFEAWRDGQKTMDTQLSRRLELLEQKK